MVIFYLVLAVFTFVILVLFFVRQYSKHRSKFRELAYMLSQTHYEYILLDLRSQNEYEKGHCPGARNIAFEKLSTYMPTENMFEKIFVYGRNASQARRACGILGSAGYFNVKSFGSYHTVMLYKRYLKKEKQERYGNS